jgi:hypothetical protein
MNVNNLDSTIQICFEDIELHILKDFFTKKTYKKINQVLELLILDESNWEPINNIIPQNRKRLKMEKSNFFTDLNGKIREEGILLSSINKKLNENYKNCGFTIWWDEEGYQIPHHVDNEAIVTSIQIYLGNYYNVNLSLGTSFSYIHLDNDIEPKNIFTNPQTIFTLPYYPNSGYIYKNSNKLLHGLTTKVPKGFNRFSMYFYIN